MANIITLLRLLLVFVITALIEYASPLWQLINVPLVIIIMSLDGIDGIVARACKETSLFGAVFDVAADRIIELVLWVTLLKTGFVSVWVPIIFIVRGVLVDSLRKQHENIAPFSIMQTFLGRFLVASRIMRFFYGGLKFVTFTWLLFLVPIPTLQPKLWLSYHTIVFMVNDVLIYLTLTVCLVRGLPVIIESITCAWLHNVLLSLRGRFFTRPVSEDNDV